MNAPLMDDRAPGACVLGSVAVKTNSKIIVILLGTIAFLLAALLAAVCYLGVQVAAVQTTRC